jgi:hypothetical protein
LKEGKEQALTERASIMNVRLRCCVITKRGDKSCKFACEVIGVGVRGGRMQEEGGVHMSYTCRC